MILALDIGNSNITVGCIDSEKIKCIERISTDIGLTSVEYAIRLKSILEIYNINHRDLKGAVISSVVPQLTAVLEEAINKLLYISTFIVGPGIKTGIDIKIDDPSQLGSSLLVCAVAALAEHRPPVIVIEMSTATTFCVINKEKQYIGGVICSGIRTSLDSLVSSASLLHQVNLENPKNIIGRNTADSMKSGIIFGSAACVDGITNLIENEIDEKCTLIATGLYAPLIIPHCEREIIFDNELMLKGLNLIYKKNCC